MNKTITPRQFAALIACYIQGSLLSMMYYYNYLLCNSHYFMLILYNVPNKMYNTNIEI